ALDVVEGKSENDRQLVDESRLEGRKPVLSEPDERRRDRLMRATLGRERDAGGGGHQDESRVLIAGIVERIEPALNEGIIKRADGDEPLAVDGMREPERGQQDEQVHLGDAELDMLALRRKIPVEGGRD